MRELRKIIEEIEKTEDRVRVGYLLEKGLKLIEDGKVSSIRKIGKNRVYVYSTFKEFILCVFKHSPVVIFEKGGVLHYDKKHLIPINYNRELFMKLIVRKGIRVVPIVTIRRGTHIEGPGTILMGGTYINIGARIGKGSLIDTNVLVGSCAWIGKNVHVGANTVIAGVLEPPQARPVIVDDNVFVGANCTLSEGVWIQENAVIGQGVSIAGKSTKVFDIVNMEIIEPTDNKPVVIPEEAVVVPGVRIKKELNGELIGAYTPIIVKYKDEQTDTKTSLEDALRTIKKKESITNIKSTLKR